MEFEELKAKLGGVSLYLAPTFEVYLAVLGNAGHINRYARGDGRVELIAVRTTGEQPLHLRDRLWRRHLRSIERGLEAVQLVGVGLFRKQRRAARVLKGEGDRLAVALKAEYKTLTLLRICVVEVVANGDGRCWPPAQIRASRIAAYGACLRLDLTQSGLNQAQGDSAIMQAPDLPLILDAGLQGCFRQTHVQDEEGGHIARRIRFGSRSVHFVLRRAAVFCSLSRTR